MVFEVSEMETQEIVTEHDQEVITVEEVLRDLKKVNWDYLVEAYPWFRIQFSFAFDELIMIKVELPQVSRNVENKACIIERGRAILDVTREKYEYIMELIGGRSFWKSCGMKLPRILLDLLREWQKEDYDNKLSLGEIITAMFAPGYLTDIAINFLKKNKG